MPIDPKFSESAINTDYRAVIEQYGFDVRDDNGHFIVYDPEYRKNNHGRAVKYGPGSNLPLLLSTAMENRKAYDADKAAEPVATSKKRGRKADAGGAAADGVTSETCNDTVGEPQTASSPSDVTENEKAAAALSELWMGPWMQDDNVRDVITKYGLDVGRNSTGDYVVNDPAVAAFYAFSDASKKGKYVGTDLTEVLLAAATVHDDMVAERDGVAKSDTSAVKLGEKSAAKSPKIKKDNRYLRAFPVIAKAPAGNVTPEAVAKEANLSASMAAACILAWEAAIKTISENYQVLDGLALVRSDKK